MDNEEVQKIVLKKMKKEDSPISKALKTNSNQSTNPPKLYDLTKLKPARLEKVLQYITNPLVRHLNSATPEPQIKAKAPAFVKEELKQTEAPGLGLAKSIPVKTKTKKAKKAKKVAPPKAPEFVVPKYKDYSKPVDDFADFNSDGD